jgi:hypothetical protein
VKDGRAALGFALAAGMLTHGHQGAQAFRKNSFETAFVHVK